MGRFIFQFCPIGIDPARGSLQPRGVSRFDGPLNLGWIWRIGISCAERLGRSAVVGILNIRSPRTIERMSKQILAVVYLVCS